MPKISVLPDHIASQIAAGEVVERPASVVKELVENSVDAGASQIEISINSDCRDIRVADDGCGMSADDAVLAFHRHATSKLNSAEDLNNLRTLGFRGEALPSIASVARATCITRSADQESGIRVDCADGVVQTRETGCAPGTVIEITDLFYNVPARMKFLKKASTEFGHIHETIQHLAISYPKIVFQLLNKGEVVLRTTGSGKLAEVIKEVGLISGKDELLPVTDVDMRFGMAIYGYVVRAPQCRGDRKGIVTIVNNRPVRCPLTYKALDYAFSDLIPRGKYPLGAITITLDPALVDVNVHPTKKEIKYSNSSEVYLGIQKALVESTRRLPAGSPVTLPEVELPVDQETGEIHAPEMAAVAPTRLEPASVVAESAATGSLYRPAGRAQQISFRDRLSTAAVPAVQAPAVSGSGSLTARKAHLPEGWHLLGYIHNTYFLFDTPDGFTIVEQHIAHERLLYERILAGQESRGRISTESQPLVISSPLNLSPTQKAVLEERADDLRLIGFDFSLQGNAVNVTKLPLQLVEKNYAGSIQQIIEELIACEYADFQLEATKSLACQAAIKNGMTLSEPDIVSLVSQWYVCSRRDTCPHGRPVSLRFSKDKLFQMFHPA